MINASTRRLPFQFYFLAIWLCGLTAMAQEVSLLADDTLDDISVNIGGVSTPVTVMRDAYNPNQWYYVPRSPRLVEAKTSAGVEPIFHLYRYQYPDPADPQKLNEGGLLQFEASFALPSDALAELRSAVSIKTKLPEAQLRLSSLRIKSAQVSLYTPGEGGLFVSTPPSGSGVAPIFSTQNMAFAVPLTKAGAAFYEGLSKGTAGLKLQVSFVYGGLTPPAGFTVHVDYKQLHKHYSKEEKFRAEVSYYGLWGASYDSQSQYIRNELINSGGMTIDIQEGESLKLADIDKYLQPIVKRINDQLLEFLKPPAEVAPANANGSGKGGYFGSANYSVAVKDISNVRANTEDINFRFRQYAERTTNANGFISIASYSPDVQKRLLSVVPGKNWESAYFILPPVGDAFGIDSIDLTVSLKSGDVMLPQQVVQWRPAAGWKDREGRPRTVLTFALLEKDITADKLANAQFLSTLQITSQGKTLKLEQKDQAFQGDRAISTPTNSVDIVSIDGSDLTWRRIDPKSSLDRVLVTLKCENRQQSFELRPRNVNGTLGPPDTIHWMVPSLSIGRTAPVIADIQFEMKDGKRKAWSGNGNISEKFPDLLISLKDAFWQAQ